MRTGPNTPEHVTTTLKTLLGQSQEIGLHDFLNFLSRKDNTTFEQAREHFYETLNTQNIILTPQYTVRLFT